VGRRIRIPFLIDVMRVDDAYTIGVLAKDPRLDRGYTPTGPLFNRLLAWRLMRVFRIGATPFPTMRARGDEERRAKQAALAARLPDPATLLADIAPLVDYVRGKGAAGSAGPAVQSLIGRLFKTDYAASSVLWTAAVDFDAAARSTNPLRWLMSYLRGNLRSSRRVLAEAVDNNEIAVHATGVAVHNVMATLDRMRAAFADPARRSALDGVSAATAMLAAPASVLRQTKRIADVPGGTLQPGTLVTFQLAAAAERALDRRIAFQSESWSACPASTFVFGLLALVWTRARAEAERP
jgi:hypothetical protein